MWTKLFRIRKSQTVMIFFVVFLCTTLMNGAMTILAALKEPYKQLKEECNPANMIIYCSGEQAEADYYKEKFEALKEVNRVIRTKYTYLRGEVYVGENKIDAFVDLVEYSRDAYPKLRYVEGSKAFEQDLAEGKCFIPACIQNEYHLQIGDVLTIMNAQGEIKYEIAGVVAEPYSISTAFDSAVFVQKLPDQLKNVQYNLKVFAGEGYTGNDIIAAYQKENTGAFSGFVQTLESVENNSLIAVNIVAAAFLAIGIIMMIVSGLIINFMVRHAMIADAKNIAVYKTMGYTTGTILQMYLSFYFVIVMVAGILGVFCSKPMAEIVLDGLFANLGQTTNINVIQTGIWNVLAVIAFVLTIVYLVIRKTRNVKPIYALNGLKSSNTKKKRYRSCADLSFSPMGIALRNMQRNKKGIIGIAATIAATVFAVNFAIISLDVAFSQKDNNDYWIGVDRSDIIVNVLDSNYYAEIEKIVAADDKVERYLNANFGQRVLLDWDSVDATPGISAFIYEDYNLLELPVVEGRNPQNETEIAIASVVGKNQKKEVGDYLTCYLDKDTKVDLMISGIFQTYYQLGDACRLCTATYTESQTPLEYNSLSIYLRDDGEKEAFIQELTKKIGSKGEVIPRTEWGAGIMNMIVEPQKSGIPPVMILVFIISAINIFCIVLLKNAANQKTNEIYKSIGYSTWDLILSNLYYVGIVAISVMVVTIPLSIWGYPRIMQMALSVFEFRSYPMSINVWHLVLGNGSVLTMFILSTFLSSRSIHKINVRDLVIE